jgi:hypothetical protein
LSNRSFEAALVILMTLLWAILPFKSTLVAVGGTKPEVGADFRTELEVGPEKQSLKTKALSEFGFFYEAELFKVDGEAEMDSGGIADGALALEISRSAVNGEAEIDLGEGWKSIESCNFSAELGQSTRTDLSVEYETGNCPGRDVKALERGLALDLEHEVGDGVTAGVSTRFSSESGSLISAPEDSTAEIRGLRAGELVLNPVLEAEKLDPVEIELGYEMREPLLTGPDLSLEGELNWRFSENFIEFAPELITEEGTISLEGEVGTFPGNSDQFFKIQELELSELELGKWEFEVLNDFSSEEVELDLFTEIEDFELELSFLLGGKKKSYPVYLEELEGSLTWNPEESYEVELEAETGFEKSLPEIALVSDYSF